MAETNHAIAVDKLLGYDNRVVMTNRDGLTPPRRPTSKSIASSNGG